MFAAHRFGTAELRERFRGAKSAAEALSHVEVLDEVLRETAAEALRDTRAWEDPSTNPDLRAFWTSGAMDDASEDSLRLLLEILGPESVTERAVRSLRREVRFAAARWAPELSAPLLLRLLEARDTRLKELLAARGEGDVLCEFSPEVARRLLEKSRAGVGCDDLRIEAYTELGMLASICPLGESARGELLSRLQQLPRQDFFSYHMQRGDDGSFVYEPADEARQVLGVLLEDRETPTSVLRAVIPWAARLQFGRGVMDLATHPKADKEVWKALLEAEGVSPSVKAAVGSEKRAWEDAEVRSTLDELLRSAEVAGEGAVVRYFFCQGAPRERLILWWDELLQEDPELALALVLEVRPEMAEAGVVSDAQCERLLANEGVRRELLLANAGEDPEFEEDRDQMMTRIAIAPGADFAFRLIERWKGEGRK